MMEVQGGGFTAVQVIGDNGALILAELREIREPDPCNLALQMGCQDDFVMEGTDLAEGQTGIVLIRLQITEVFPVGDDFPVFHQDRPEMESVDDFFPIHRIGQFSLFRQVNRMEIPVFVNLQNILLSLQVILEKDALTENIPVFLAGDKVRVEGDDRIHALGNFHRVIRRIRFEGFSGGGAQLGSVADPDIDNPGAGGSLLVRLEIGDIPVGDFDTDGGIHIRIVIQIILLLRSETAGKIDGKRTGDQGVFHGDFFHVFREQIRNGKLFLRSGGKGEAEDRQESEKSGKPGQEFP